MKKLDPAIDDFLHRCQESPFSRRLDLWSFLGTMCTLNHGLKWDKWVLNELIQCRPYSVYDARCLSGSRLTVTVWLYYRLSVWSDILLLTLLNAILKLPICFVTTLVQQQTFCFLCTIWVYCWFVFWCGHIFCLVSDLLCPCVTHVATVYDRRAAESTREVSTVVEEHSETRQSISCFSPM